MNFNIETIFKEALEEFLPDFKKKSKEHFKNFFERKIKFYFYDKKEIQQFKDNPNLAWTRGVDLKDKDLGAGSKMVDDFIVENILEDRFQQYMKKYMEDNFHKHLNEAMDKAMKHKADKMVFNPVNTKKD